MEHLILYNSVVFETIWEYELKENFNKEKEVNKSR